MKKIIVRGLAFIGGFVVLGIIIGVSIGLIFRTSTRSIPDKVILELDFARGIVEYTPDGSIAGFFKTKALTVRDVVEALERASKDKRVVALIARVSGAGMELAQIQEVRDAILAFRNAGKSAIAYADTFGEFGPGNGVYYLATACDEIYLQPSGSVGLTGLISESPFLRGTLDKLGVAPRLDHRKEYKNVMNIFTERKYTVPHREAVQKVMDSQFGQIVNGVAIARGLSAEEVRTLVNRGPFWGQQAVEAKLVSGLAYRDEMEAKVKEQTGADAKPLDLLKYLDRAGRPYEKGETIALIYGVGGVQRGKRRDDPVSGDSSMGADTVTAAFRAAAEDRGVKAILFRVDSPGGSYVASDTIWRETLRVKQAGKPVIVSMGNVAGSGGYFIAMAADKIVAQPGTITGSIGVLAGKMLTTGFWDKIGVSWDEVHTSDNATMWTSTRDYTPAQWTQFQSWLDQVYDDFTSKAAQGRNLSKEKILEVAKGRIWTGEDAKALGLVDELGGFPVALRLAKEAAGIPQDADIHLKLFPRKKTTLWQMLIERLLEEEEENEEEDVPAVITHVFQMIQPLARLVQNLGLSSNPGVLTMPELEPVR